MTAVLQRVKRAEVKIDGETVGACDEGLLILLGVAAGDEEKDADALVDKIVKFRIFSDENGKMNRSVTDISGSVLLVSNFTLCGSYRHGNRPDFCATAAPPALANALYEHFAARMRLTVPVETGRFGADMEVSLVNDGPVTFVLESGVLLKK
ncbi:MAG: D-tyrosyl-tRNA(Tyr) deacylase [Clostridia bacterium]|nr:D-tyrosyl-tRNA(Tyr) deacylase [Clostridia bacterium]